MSETAIETGAPPPPPATAPRPAPAREQRYEQPRYEEREREPPREPETFSRQYVHELREEAKKYREAKDAARAEAAEARTKAMETEQARAAALKEAEAAARKLERDAEAKIAAAQAEVTAKANDRIILAELRGAALKAGIRDPADLKLVDRSGLKINDNDEVEGVNALIENLKTTKPYLFELPTTTSTAAAPTGREAPKSGTALDLSAEEFRARRDRIRRGLPLD